MLSFERTKQPQQLHDAISAMQKVVEMTTDDHPYRYSFHITLSIAFGHRYDISHNIDDLDASIHASKSALELIPENNIVAHTHILGNLGTRPKIKMKKRWDKACKRRDMVWRRSFFLKKMVS